MVELDTEKFRQDFNKLNNNELSTLDNAYKEYDKITSLANDLSYYYIKIMSNFCSNILLKNDFFTIKYPFSIIKMIDSETIEISSCNGSSFYSEYPNCKINLKEKTFYFNYFDDTSLDNDKKIKYYKNEIIKYKKEINSIKKTRIDINYREQLLKDGFSALKEFHMKTFLHLLILSQTISDKRITNVIETYKYEIKTAEDSIKDFQDKLLHLKNKEWLLSYKKYNISFKNDLISLLKSFGFNEIDEKEEYLPYSLFQNYINYVDFYIFKNDDIIKSNNTKRINQHSYKSINKL